VIYSAFDPAPCGFPQPRVPLLPQGLAGISLTGGRSLAGQQPSPAAALRHFKRARYALHEACRLAGIGAGSALLAPSYHCRTMLDPALSRGGEVLLYPLLADLSPDLAALDALHRKSALPIKAVLATHYFGRAANFAELAAWCKANGLALIEDCSHALYLESFQAPGIALHGDFVVASPYKFLPLDDGGLLGSKTPLAGIASPLRGQGIVAETAASVGFLGSRPARGDQRHGLDLPSLGGEIEALMAKEIVAGRVSEFETSALSADYRREEENRQPLLISRLLMRFADVDSIAAVRRHNYRMWLAAVSELPHCRPLFPELADDCIPYMFPLYLEHPDFHFCRLKQLGVPVGRWDSVAVSSCAVATDYRFKLLHLPCHQGLAEEQMRWLTQAVGSVLSVPPSSLCLN